MKVKLGPNSSIERSKPSSSSSFLSKRTLSSGGQRSAITSSSSTVTSTSFIPEVKLSEDTDEADSEMPNNDVVKQGRNQNQGQDPNQNTPNGTPKSKPSENGNGSAKERSKRNLTGTPKNQNAIDISESDSDSGSDSSFSSDSSSDLEVIEEIKFHAPKDPNRKKIKLDLKSKNKVVKVDRNIDPKKDKQPSEIQNQLSQGSGTSSNKTSALSIDRIRNTIFGCLSHPELKKCRLVSSLWKSFVGPVLEKSTKQLNFVGFNLNNGKNPKTLENLYHLLNANVNDPKSESSVSFLCKNLRFYLKYPQVIHPLFQEFLHEYGSLIEELTIIICPDVNDYEKPDESEVSIPLQILILRQARNLKYLSLSMDTEIQWEKRDHTTHNNTIYVPLRVTDPEYKAIHKNPNLIPKKRGRKSKLELENIRKAKEEKNAAIFNPSLKVGNSSRDPNANPNVNTSLRVVNLRGTNSAKIMELIVKLAPNLEKIIHMENCYQYFVKPVNRLHLLKEVSLDMSNPESRETFKSIEKLTIKDDLQLCELFIRIYDGYEGHKLRADKELRAVKVINRILESSCDTLQSIVWDDFTTLPGLKWPLIMSKLTKIKLLNPHYLQRRESILFPPGLNLSVLFPNLQEVVLDDFQGKEDFTNFIHVFNSPEPLSSVKHLRIHRDGIGPKKLELTPGHFRQIYRIFPNCKFTRNIHCAFDYEDLIPSAS